MTCSLLHLLFLLLLTLCFTAQLCRSCLEQLCCQLLLVAYLSRRQRQSLSSSYSCCCLCSCSSRSLSVSSFPHAGRHCGAFADRRSDFLDSKVLKKEDVRVCLIARPREETILWQMDWVDKRSGTKEPRAYAELLRVLCGLMLVGSQKKKKKLTKQRAKRTMQK